jgi:hypothetical protein
MDAGPTVQQKVGRLASRFARADIPHAFGGEVALAAHGGPRPFSRIDLHVFLAPREADAVLARLAVLGIAVRRREALARIASRRRIDVVWGETPLMLAFGLDGLHGLVSRRLRRVPLGERWVQVLSVEDLVLASRLALPRLPAAAVDAMVAAAGEELDRAYLVRASEALGLGSFHPGATIQRLPATQGS